MHLRELPHGTDFYLIRTGQRFKFLLRVKYKGKVWFMVRQDGTRRVTTLHHSCHIKPVIPPARTRLLQTSAHASD